MFPSTTTKVLTLLIRWLMLSLAVWVAAELISGIHLEGWQSTLIVAAILGLLNMYVRPVLVLVSFPITILSLGLFLIFINAALLGLTDWIANLSDEIHFDVEGIGASLLGALVISLVSLILGWFVKPERIARDLTGESRWI
jgi:putative membrane protein